MMAQKLKRIITLICVSTIVIMLCVPTVHASSGITLTVSDISANQGEDVEVPIILSGNDEGIAGMTIFVSYDSKLTLKSIARGNALSSLNYTPPGNLNANPLNLVFYGLDGDTSNGTVATLIFTAPLDMTGKMNINVSYTVGNIYDGNLNDLDVTIINGSVDVNAPVNNSEFTVDNYNRTTDSITFDVKLPSANELNGTVIVALYKDDDSMETVELYPVQSTVNVALDSADGKYIKVMWWSDMSKCVPLSEIVQFNVSN